MKNKVILVGRDGRPSMKLVYSKLIGGELVVRRRLYNKRREIRKEYYRHYLNNEIDHLTKEPIQPFDQDSIVIRWGTREDIPVDNRTIIYNKSAAIANGTDKKAARIMMTDANVAVPKMVTPVNVTDKHFPIIARPPVHAKGKNFVVLNDYWNFNDHYQKHKHWYYSAFIDKDKEYRVHCAHGKVLAVMEKPKPQQGQIAWNRAINEDPFIYVPWNEVDNPIMAAVMNEALKAVEVLGLDFGGTDVIVQDGKPYVLEVNTAPTLNSSDYVAGRWAQYFGWLFRSETRRDHWNFDEFKKGKSFIWKNFQLDE